MSPSASTVLVAGVQGVIGRHATKHYSRQPGTTVVGLSRRPGDLPGVRHFSADLLRPEELRQILRPLRDEVTHLVFAAYLERPTAAERSQANAALLTNLLNATEDFPTLRHLTFYQGGKAYGSDLGPYKTPAREADPRLMPPNFYYNRENLIRQRQQGGDWRFTGLRPDGVGGFAVGNPMNITMVIAEYTVLSKELGLPLRFPGTETAYRAMTQLTSADVLAEATIWAGSSPAARDEIFNVTNGDTFRWQHLWLRLARMFGMEAAEPVRMPLAAYMADKQPLWEAMTRKYGLADIPYARIVAWPFGDAVFSTIKARRAGFHGCIDTEEMFGRFFDDLRRQKIIPPL